MVKLDNDLRQQQMDEEGIARDRGLNVRIYFVMICLYKVADLFSWDSSLSPVSPIRNTSYFLYTRSISYLVALSSPFMIPLLELGRITFHRATDASASRSSLTVLAYHPFTMNFRTARQAIN
jgi:hypothetical protein